MSAEQTESRCPNADSRAITLALNVRDAVGAPTVIIHGSRARGDHRPDSDVNVILVHDHSRLPTPEEVRTATDAGRAEAERLYGPDVKARVSWAHTNTVLNGRNSVNGGFARALEEGLARNRHWWRADWHTLPPPENESHEPCITIRLMYESRAQRFLATKYRGRPGVQTLVLAHHGSLALKRALQAYISACRVRYPWKADTATLLELASRNGADVAGSPDPDNVDR